MRRDLALAAAILLTGAPATAAPELRFRLLPASRSGEDGRPDLKVQISLDASSIPLPLSPSRRSLARPCRGTATLAGIAIAPVIFQ